jgi:hypothetical protein
MLLEEIPWTHIRPKNARTGYMYERYYIHKRFSIWKTLQDTYDIDVHIDYKHDTVYHALEPLIAQAVLFELTNDDK